MSTYSPATIKRCATILERASAQPTRKARATKVVKDATAWERRPATSGQHARINRLEKALGYRLSTRKAIGTGLDARILYRSLKAELG